MTEHIPGLVRIAHEPMSCTDEAGNYIPIALYYRPGGGVIARTDVAQVQSVPGQVASVPPITAPNAPDVVTPVDTQLPQPNDAAFDPGAAQANIPNAEIVASTDGTTPIGDKVPPPPPPAPNSPQQRRRRQASS